MGPRKPFSNPFPTASFETRDVLHHARSLLSPERDPCVGLSLGFADFSSQRRLESKRSVRLLQRSFLYEPMATSQTAKTASFLHFLRRVCSRQDEVRQPHSRFLRHATRPALCLQLSVIVMLAHVVHISTNIKFKIARSIIETFLWKDA